MGSAPMAAAEERRAALALVINPGAGELRNQVLLGCTGRQLGNGPVNRAPSPPVTRALHGRGGSAPSWARSIPSRSWRARNSGLSRESGSWSLTRPPQRPPVAGGAGSDAIGSQHAPAGRPDHPTCWRDSRAHQGLQGGSGPAVQGAPPRPDRAHPGAAPSQAQVSTLMRHGAPLPPPPALLPPIALQPSASMNPWHGVPPCSLTACRGTGKEEEAAAAALAAAAAEAAVSWCILASHECAH